MKVRLLFEKNDIQEYGQHSPRIGGSNLQNVRPPLLGMDALGKLSSFAANGNYLDHMNGNHQNSSDHQTIQQLLAALDSSKSTNPKILTVFSNPA